MQYYLPHIGNLKLQRSQFGVFPPPKDAKTEKGKKKKEGKTRMTEEQYEC